MYWYVLYHTVMYDISWLCHSDIEECITDTHNCSQLCVEMHGGYECDCSNGYELEDNGVTCQGL